MTPLGKFAVGALIGISIAAIIYFSVKKSASEVADVNKKKIIDDIIKVAKVANRGSISEALEKRLRTNMDKVPILELDKFLKVVSKKEKDWTVADQEFFMGLVKKYDLKIGG